MSSSTSPRKVVPLATGDHPRPRKDSSVHTTTKRVFYCGVVVEGSENGKRLPDDIQDLVLSLGSPVSASASTDVLSANVPSDPPLNDNDRATQRKRALTDSSALSSVINELVTSERSYVKRLQILKNDYADPLRNFARSKDTAIIPVYGAKTLFGNIDNLLPVNEAFLTDLEKMIAPNGSKSVGGVGDVALKHFKELRGFEQYRQYYVKREDAQLIFEREVSKRSSRFASFIDHIKYQSTDPRNRVGLRELLMEPVQRIPRYTLLFRTMLKHMAPGDPQRANLVEADEIASKIALAEADEQTKRAAIFYCLTATIEGFPPDLFSNSRRFIDCIDVEDVLADSGVPSASAAGSATSLHCTLFLFDDKLVIVKRPGNGEKGGRVLTGLDELDKVTKSGGIPAGKKKSGMTCKGVVDVTDIVATDVGGAEMNFYLENPPHDQGERWSGRPFRSFSVVNPPAHINLDPIQTESDKHRFLEHLWHVQATYRARAGQSVVLCAAEQEVESKVGRTTNARTYFNVYQRTAFLQETKKTKIVVHIDPLGSADSIPFGIGTAPFARIRIQPLAGGLCRYAVSSSDPTDEGEEDIVQTERVPSRIVHTVHQFGLFEFRTGRNSRPSTPTARSRVAIFGLDAISRNLFNTRPGSTMGELFGGSINGHKRTKSTISRSSVYTQTTTTGDGSLTKFSHRSGSTAPSSIMDDDSSFFASSSSQSKKLSKRGRSTGGSTSDSERGSPFRRSLSSKSRSRSEDGGYSDGGDDDEMLGKSSQLDPSEQDLARQLELARRNSKNQHVNELPSLPLEPPFESTIYEEEPTDLRPLSRASRSSTSQKSTTSRPESCTPTKDIESPIRLSRSMSQHSQERRPMGPRSPSPLPPFKSPPSRPMEICSMDGEVTLEEQPILGPPQIPRPSGLPRSKRQPLFPTGNTNATPKPPAAPTSTTATPIVPLSIKKKTSVRSSTDVASPTPTRKPYVRNSPLARNSARVVSPRRISPQVMKRKLNLDTSQTNELTERILQLSQNTDEEVESSRKTIKRIKLQIDEFRSNCNESSENEDSRPSSLTDVEVRTPQHRTPLTTKAAQERMEEMRQLISRRQIEGDTPRKWTRTQTVYDTPTKAGPSSKMSDPAGSIETLINEVDVKLMRAASYQTALQSDLKEVSNNLKEKSSELEKARTELQNAKRQCELVKSLLADTTAEKEIMYEAFNEELDGMYNDINLPDDEAWEALSKDLRQTKETRNALSKENSELRRQIAEAELQREQWEALLRAHHLIP